MGPWCSFRAKDRGSRAGEEMPGGYEVDADGLSPWGRCSHRMRDRRSGTRSRLAGDTGSRGAALNVKGERWTEPGWGPNPLEKRAKGARPGHPDRITRSSDKQNIPILRRGTLRATGGKYGDAAAHGSAGAVVAYITPQLSAVEPVRSARVRGASASPPTDRCAAGRSARNQGCWRTRGRG